MPIYFCQHVIIKILAYKRLATTSCICMYMNVYKYEFLIFADAISTDLCEYDEYSKGNTVT